MESTAKLQSPSNKSYFSPYCVLVPPLGVGTCWNKANHGDSAF